MSQNKNLSLSLFLLRVSVFIVFLVWSVDKFVRPEHASAVFQHFYFSPGFGPKISYALGTAQLVISTGFLLGYKKRLTYGIIFLLHLISTLSSYKQYMSPYGEINILFFAAWPMLAACAALYLLRDHDDQWTFFKNN